MIYNFENGTDTSWTFEGNPSWHLDNLEKIHGNYSLRSGKIDCSGRNSISRVIQGPAEISFWWKADFESQDTKSFIDFEFLVDNRVERICRSSDWKKEHFSISDSKPHNISWSFLKRICYPNWRGTAWIDDVEVRQEENFTADINYINNNQFLNDQKINLTEYIFNLNNSTNKSILDIKKDISWLNKIVQNDSKRENILEKVMLNLKESVKFLNNNKIITVRSTNDLIFALNNNSIGTIILENNTYYGPINISRDNIKLISKHEDGAIFNNSNENYIFKIENSSGISIEGVYLGNGIDYGICAINTSNSNFESNKIKFNNIGIYLLNCNNIILSSNCLYNNSNNSNGASARVLSIGIKLNKSNCNYILHNEISSKDFDIYLNESYGNIIVDKLPCHFRDNGQEMNNNQGVFRLFDMQLGHYIDTEFKYIYTKSNFWACHL